MVKLVEKEKPVGIPLRELPMGKLAIVVWEEKGWEGEAFIGRLLIRPHKYPDDIIYLDSGGHDPVCDNSTRVRVLEEGEMIEV